MELGQRIVKALAQANPILDPSSAALLTRDALWGRQRVHLSRFSTDLSRPMVIHILAV